MQNIRYSCKEVFNLRTTILAQGADIGEMLAVVKDEIVIAGA